ncbi:MAG TPA: Nif11-like leader peptide family natural product precursor [Acidimicrobiales bacterium]|nr:Nif11-like leader peptide family natural product precursor [Acidimicrobiales bacterium]
MSAEAAQALVERLASDPDLRSRMEGAGSPEEARQMAREAGFDVTPEDMQELQQGSQKGLFESIGGLIDMMAGT